MHGSTTTRQDLIEQIQGLPPDSLDDLAAYIDFLRFRAGKAEEDEPAEQRLRVVKGYDFSPELLAAARREMWQGMESTEA